MRAPRSADTSPSADVRVRIRTTRELISNYGPDALLRPAPLVSIAAMRGRRNI